MDLTLKIALLVAALFVFDRLLLALEAKGYVYYRKKKASLRSTGSVLMELHGVIEPRAKNVIEAKQQVVHHHDESGPPKPDEPFVVPPRE